MMRWIIGGGLVLIGVALLIWSSWDREPDAARPVTTDDVIRLEPPPAEPRVDRSRTGTPGLILAVRYPDGEPVPNARVAIEAGSGWSELLHESKAVAVVADEYRRTTNATGECDVSDLGSGFWDVRVLSGKLGGVGQIRIAEGPVIGWKTVITVEPIRQIVVEVVDADGLPAERIPVSLRDPSEPGRPFMMGAPCSPRGHLPNCWTYTDAQGRARFVAMESVNAALFHARRIEAAAHPHGAPKVTATTAWGSANAELALRLETASRVLDVSIVSAGEETPDSDVELIWGVVQEFGTLHDWAEGVRNGRVRLGGFIPGKTYGFRMAHSFHPVGSENVLVASTDDRVQAVSFDLGRPYGRVKIRSAYDGGGDGTRLAHTLVLEGDARPPESLFDLLHAPYAYQDGAKVFGVVSGAEGTLVMRRRAANRDEQPEIVAALPIPPIGAGQVLDLGTLVLPRPPTFIAGRVVDESGNAVTGATVSVTGKERTKPSFSGSLWQETDEHGRFEIHGRPDPRRSYTLSLSGPYACEPLEVTPGATDIVVTAVKRGRMSGRIHVARELRGGLRLELQAPTLTYDRHVRVRAGGHFTTPLMAPGSYDLVITLDGFRGPEVRRISDITIAPGEHARPANLADIVVGEGLRMAEVQVLHRDGKPFRAACVAFRELSGGTDPLDAFEHTNENGIATSWCRKGKRLQIEVSTERYGPRFVEPTVFPVIVRLDPLTETTLEFSRPLPPQPTRGWVLSIRTPFTPAELAFERSERPRWGNIRSLRPDRFVGWGHTAAGSRQARIRKLPPGTRARLYARPSRRKPKRHPAEVDLGPIRIPEFDEEPTVKVTITAAQYAALERCEANR